MSEIKKAFTEVVLKYDHGSSATLSPSNESFSVHSACIAEWHSGVEYSYRWTELRQGIVS